MELTPIAWLLVIVALILGFLVGYFRFKPQVPPLLYGGKRFRVGEDKPKIPATGGTVNFEDAYGNEFQVQLPRQTRAREITFTSSQPEPLDDPKLKNPTGEKVYRILMHLTATDAKGEVRHFDPYVTTIAKYIPDDLAKVGGDVDGLIRLRHDGEAWRRLPMPVKSRDTKQKTLTAYVESFSSIGRSSSGDSCGVGGGP